MPVSLVRWLMFYGLLAYGANTRWKIFGYGCLFLAGTLVMEILTGLGAFDKMFIGERFGVFMSGLIFILGLGCGGLGVIGIRDWWRLKFAPARLALRPPAFLIAPQTSSWSFLVQSGIPRSGAGMIFAVVMISLAASLVAGYWPGEFVFKAYAFLLSQQNPPSILNRYALYIFGKLLPLVCVWLSVAALHQSRGANTLSRISFVRIVSAAFCVAVGAGLLLNFFVNFNQM